MAQKRDLYQEVTNKVVAAIEAGASGKDWSPPWHHVHRGMPYNATSRHEYRGVNVLMLWATAIEARYPASQWASYKQWQAAGAQVRQGERGTMVVYAGQIVKESETKQDGETSSADRVINFLKCSHVFNAAQVDGWESEPIERPALAERLASVDQFVNATEATIRYGMDGAYYAPKPDFIGMPDWDRFKASENATATENAYSTILHELTHWTGPKHRCDRQFGKRFGDNAYAAEELVAELGAAFLCARLDITSEPRVDHAQYLDHWLGILKSDKKAIFTAASKASQAVDYLVALQGERRVAA